MISPLTLFLASTLTVIDGDTIELNRQRIRIANIDAPELRHAQCDAERRLAIIARNRLSALLKSGQLVVKEGDPVDGRVRDRHGRTLATITIDGRDVGDILIAEELARQWGRRRRSGCAAA